MEEIMLRRGPELQVWLFFGFLILFLAVEMLAMRRPLPKPRHVRWLTNAGFTLLVILMLPLLPVSLISVAFWAESAGVGFFNAYSLPLPAIIFITIMLLLRGFISYLTHFLNHKIPFLWRFHRVHHMDSALDVSTTVRLHPLELVFSLIVGLPIVVLLGLSPWVLLLYELLDVSVTLFSHSNFRLPRRIDSWLRYLLVTPNLHIVHHSSWQPETESNFSAVFPIWDIVFGTFRTETREPIESMQLGLEEFRGMEINRFWWLLRSPFSRF